MPNRVKIKIRYAGKCQTCGLPIEKGEIAAWAPATKALIHIGCELIHTRHPTLQKGPPVKKTYGMPLAPLPSDETPA